MSGLIIIESSILALAARPLAGWQPRQLHRIAALTAHGQLGEQGGVIFNTEALAEVDALQEAGYRVGVWRPDGERSDAISFWRTHGLVVSRGSLKGTVEQRHHQAAFVLTPRNKHRGVPAYRDCVTTGSLLHLPPRAVNAATAMLRGDFYA